MNTRVLEADISCCEEKSDQVVVGCVGGWEGVVEGV